MPVYIALRDGHGGGRMGQKGDEGTSHIDITSIPQTHIPNSLGSLKHTDNTSSIETSPHCGKLYHWKFCECYSTIQQISLFSNKNESPLYTLAYLAYLLLIKHVRTNGNIGQRLQYNHPVLTVAGLAESSSTLCPVADTHPIHPSVRAYIV